MLFLPRFVFAQVSSFLCLFLPRSVPAQVCSCAVLSVQLSLTVSVCLCLCVCVSLSPPFSSFLSLSLSRSVCLSLCPHASVFMSVCCCVCALFTKNWVPPPPPPPPFFFYLFFFFYKTVFSGPVLSANLHGTKTDLGKNKSRQNGPWQKKKKKKKRTEKQANTHIGSNHVRACSVCPLSVCPRVNTSWFHYRTEEGSVRTSEFTDEMDELFFWIDETENILGSTLKLDPQYLTDLLEKVKVRCYIWL